MPGKRLLELAQGGTLFLDEIESQHDDVSLRAPAVSAVRWLGGTETLRPDVRIVAATNADIERAVESGTFREDLYYRINIFTITLPLLRTTAGHPRR